MKKLRSASELIAKLLPGAVRHDEAASISSTSRAAGKRRVPKRGHDRVLNTGGRFALTFALLVHQTSRSPHRYGIRRELAK
jgi:hypothetical protein